MSNRISYIAECGDLVEYQAWSKTYSGILVGYHTVMEKGNSVRVFGILREGSAGFISYQTAEHFRYLNQFVPDIERKVSEERDDRQFTPELIADLFDSLQLDPIQ